MKSDIFNRYVALKTQINDLMKEKDELAHQFRTQVVKKLRPRFSDRGGNGWEFEVQNYNNGGDIVLIVREPVSYQRCPIAPDITLNDLQIIKELLEADDIMMPEKIKSKNDCNCTKIHIRGVFG